LGGMPPVVAPEGNLGFGGKPSCPLHKTYDIYIVVTDWGVGHVIFTTKYLEILARDRSGVAVGCSKRW
jgi:hypothetical protein